MQKVVVWFIKRSRISSARFMVCQWSLACVLSHCSTLCRVNVDRCMYIAKFAVNSELFCLTTMLKCRRLTASFFHKNVQLHFWLNFMHKVQDRHYLCSISKWEEFWTLKSTNRCVSEVRHFCIKPFFIKVLHGKLWEMQFYPACWVQLGLNFRAGCSVLLLSTHCTCCQFSRWHLSELPIYR